MKTKIIYLAVALFCCIHVKAQNVNPRQPGRNIPYVFISGDSTKLALNADFELIEDSCATIYRYARLDTTLGKFIGHIKDVSKANPNLVITEGTYDKDGNKQGTFVSNFLNGQPESRGSFVNDKFDGKWQLFYDNGKPRLNFEIHGNDVQLNDYWDASGTKIINNGSGKYKFELGEIYWEGHLLNGRPAGTWYAYKNNGKTDAPIITEIYKLGVFQVGKAPSGKEYRDAARLELITPDMLPYTRAESLRPSAIPCGLTASSVVHPKYKDGIDVYNDRLADEIKQALRATDLKQVGSNKFSITAMVDDKGYLTNFKAINAFDEVIANKLILALKGLPPLEPVVINGRRLSTRLTVNFIFNGGYCNYNYTFTTNN